MCGYRRPPVEGELNGVPGRPCGRSRSGTGPCCLGPRGGGVPAALTSVENEQDGQDKILAKFP